MCYINNRKERKRSRNNTEKMEEREREPSQESRLFTQIQRGINVFFFFLFKKVGVHHESVTIVERETE